MKAPTPTPRRRKKPAPAEAVVRPLSADQLWAIWKAVREVLPMWRMPFDAMFSRAVWTLVGSDYVWGLRHDPLSRRIFDLMRPLSPRDMRRLLLIARLNQRRHEAISRWTAVAFVTLPLSFGLAMEQLQPALFRRFVDDWDIATFNTLLVVGGIVIYILACAWRARQMASVVELGLIEYAVSFESEPGEDDASPLGTEL
ncbi:MAG TPA: hypothetical protein PLE81_06705 [Brevundimonas sp.]|uniref:hypothetical protein n=1 Tax=Brevundimonas sp. TaxID=1871086 RepID=UPI002C3885C8|nr:hypothetical protein [Brevundimonas sp.]HRH20316.1 hypothetical protein [Brevundimonas sp.]